MSISAANQKRYHGLAELEESDAPLATEGETLRGDAAATAGHALFLEALGSEEAIEEEIRRGRPHVGSSTPAGAQSPVIRARIDPAREARLKAIAWSTGKKPSTLLREALDLLLVSYETGQPQVVPVDPGLLEKLSEQLHSATKVVDEQLSGARR